MIPINNIYTLTMNPAIDLFISMDQLLPNIVNRTNSTSYKENGKAVNISRILYQMDIPSIAMGFIGGFSGNFIDTQLNKTGIQTDFIEVEGITRINVFLQAQDEYKIVNKGPHIPSEKIKELLQQITQLPSNSYLFISGSLPLGIDMSIYHDILQITNKKDINVILDISDKIILQCLKYKPYLIKPNDEELATFFDVTHKLTRKEILLYSKKMIDLGCPRMLVSLGENGAIYIDKDHVLTVNAPTGVVVNTTCAGDTLLSAFMGRLFKGDPLADALIFASASASSTAFTEDITDFLDVNQLIEQVDIKRGI